MATVLARKWMQECNKYERGNVMQAADNLAPRVF